MHFKFLIESDKDSALKFFPVKGNVKINACYFSPFET